MTINQIKEQVLRHLTLVDCAGGDELAYMTKASNQAVDMACSKLLVERLVYLEQLPSRPRLRDYRRPIVWKITDAGRAHLACLDGTGEREAS